ncbi:hypothetical protein ALPR1_07020 [Algoriphagus machipongonensis]|uniref:Uncharacterized protein n=1 Tax=Algoriphagus machipongonensis TaxID=388413 RepID=A3HZH0_9BACT|nr:hypothetical protein ALPR1_07020 [Algoriphagus machipongonensis]
MELAASLFLILSIYFFGSLALTQEIIKPYKTVVAQGGHGRNLVTNYSKILLVSFSISVVSTTLAYFLFF